MRILDKYITKNIASAYFFILLLFVGLYLIIDLFSNLSHIIKAKTPLDIIGEFYLQSLPLIILRVSPFAILIGTLYTFGELNKNNEIVSLRASGLSVMKIAKPVIVFALAISCSLLFLQEKVLIHSQKRVEDIKTQFIKKKSNFGEEKKLAFVSGDMIYFARAYSPAEKTLKNVLIFQEDSNRNIVKKMVCSKIVYEYGFWIGKDIIEYGFDEEGKISSQAEIFASKKMPLKDKPNELILKKSYLAKFSSLHSLRKRINSLKRVSGSKQLADLIVDYYNKIVEPFTCFFLVIGILPLALQVKKRKAALSSLGIGFVFSLIYFALLSFSVALGKSGILIPFLSAWMAPIFFITVGATGLKLLK
tara:strand:+ start:6767 stop:7852 length:1086 start_codon:yes stop_codon:yes gene_type:complete